MIAQNQPFRAHAFEYACALADTTVRRFHYDAHDQLRNHLADYLQSLANTARTIQPQPDPPNAGTKHLSGKRPVLDVLG
jgi:hypothetical protein